MIEPKQYALNPVVISAIEVTAENIEELAKKHKGEVRKSFRVINAEGAQEEKTIASLYSNGPSAYPVDVEVTDYFVVFDPEAQRTYRLSAEQFNHRYTEKPPTYINSDYSK